MVLTSDGTWVSWLTTRKQHHILCKLSIRNSKFTKTQSLLKSSFFKARLFHCPFWFLSGSRGEDKLHLLKEQRGERRAGSQVQPRTAMQNIRKISAGRGLRRSSLPPPTQGRESFKLPCKLPMSPQTETVQCQRDLFQHLTKSPGEEFLSYSQNFTCCILWPLPLVLSLSKTDRSLALSSL